MFSNGLSLAMFKKSTGEPLLLPPTSPALHLESPFVLCLCWTCSVFSFLSVLAHTVLSAPSALFLALLRQSKKDLAKHRACTCKHVLCVIPSPPPAGPCATHLGSARDLPHARVMQNQNNNPSQGRLQTSLLNQLEI